MRAVMDQDCTPLERWAAMHEAEIALVWDTYVGGYACTMIGIDSKPISRGGGFIPGDGPDAWTGGTLFPLSSKKVARAINAASGVRPVVVLANLSGFDGSPESMRKLQLEYGAEIGRAVVNFRGPLVFCVIARYHGGAYVVFSRTLNASLEVAALEGSYASVIGGAPAAGVVLTREVDGQAYANPTVREIQTRLDAADPKDQAAIKKELDVCFRHVRAQKQGEVAEQFDKIHSVQRAKDVGSIQSIIPASQLRPFIVEALERGMRRESGSGASST
jgi:acetyl-CoA carboxylase carboxyltransferase component